MNDQPAAPAGDVIEIHHLTKSFGRQRVLDEIDLRVAVGERIALIGQNGAGKTTLIRCLLGQYIYQGHVRILGADPKRDRTWLLDSIGFVPQHPPPLQFTVAELLTLSAGLSNHATVEGITALAEDLGLDIKSLGRKVYAKLSGGMKQKVLIALALAKNPSLLVMDEPAANLDPQGRDSFLNRLRACGRDTTMLLISHRIDELAGLVDRKVELDLGKIVHDQPMNGNAPGSGDA